MNKCKIRDLFKIWQGHQITDEEIYNMKKGEIPILTGQNEIKGWTTKPYIVDVPCITIPSKGIVNKLYLQTKPFDVNNTIALIPKKRKKIDLEYFIYTKSKYITSFISSVSANNYLNKAILENIEIVYPDFPIQLKIKREYEKLIKLKEPIKNNIKNLSQQIKENVNTDGEKVTVNDVFHLAVGSDDNMTEKYAYNHTGTIPMYSGAVENKGILQFTNRIDYDFDEYITWCISGKAGTMYLRKGSCCLTRDCGIMIPKDRNEINLEWFIFTQEQSLKNFSIGRGGLGRMKMNLIQLYSFIKPEKTIQDKIVTEYKKLIMLKDRLNQIIVGIDKQLDRIVTQ